MAGDNESAFGQSGPAGYEPAKYITGRHRESCGIPPELRFHVMRVMRVYAEVKRQIGKIRELRGAAAVSKGGPAPGKK